MDALILTGLFIGTGICCFLLGGAVVLVFVCPRRHRQQQQEAVSSLPTVDVIAMTSEQWDREQQQQIQRQRARQQQADLSAADPVTADPAPVQKKRKEKENPYPDYMLVHTPDCSYLEHCRSTEGGYEFPSDSQLGDGWTMPDGAVARTLQNDRVRLHTVVVEHGALMEHRSLDRARRGLLELSAPPFRTDSFAFARTAATIVPLVISLFLIFQLLQLNSTVAELQGQGVALQALSDQIDNLITAIREGVPMR